MSKKGTPKKFAVYMIPLFYDEERHGQHRPADHNACYNEMDRFFHDPSRPKNPPDAATARHLEWFAQYRANEARTIKRIRAWAFPAITAWLTGDSITSHSFPVTSSDTSTKHIDDLVSIPLALRQVLRAGDRGVTSREVEIRLDMHGGSLSGAYSWLHKSDVVYRLKEKR